MASPSKRKADELEVALNGTENKRIRTETSPKVNGHRSQKLSSPIGDGASVLPIPQTAASKLSRSAARNKRRKERAQREKDDPTSGVPEKTRKKEPEKVLEKTPEKKPEKEAEGEGSTEIAARDQEWIAKRENHKKNHQKATSFESAPWELTRPTGGALLDLDPIFSHDEQHYLLPYDTSIAVYSISTGLLVRTLSTNRKGYITGYAIVPEEQTQLIFSLNTGYIEKWNWQDGQRISLFSTETTIASLALSSGGSGDLIYTIERHRKQWTIVAHRLRKGERGELYELYKIKEPISHFQVLDQGKYIVASTGKHLIVGSIEKPIVPESKDISYTWRDLECHEWITCLDARLSEGEAANEGRERKKSESKPSAPLRIDVVVGGLQGSLWVYRNFLGRFLENEQGKGSGSNIPQRLHWHRNAVGAVRWAVDGNYLISGGQETVLLQWQLDTGKSTTLPHLSAPIESIVVSSSERLYGVRFSNNTAMVLSAAELEPIINVTGPRIRVRRRPLIEPPGISQVSSWNKDEYLFRTSTRSAATIIPEPGHLLLAVPEASPSRACLPVSSNAPFLQTLDIRNGDHLSLQALARTKTTTRNIGPEMNVIAEPNVVLIQVSHDGQWLATVDEWVPPSVEYKHLSLDEKDLIRQLLSRAEVHLRIWSRKAKTDTWELVAKIENPHDGQLGMPGKVLDLISDLSLLGFVTIGSDARVKVWRAKRRFRDGQEVHSQDGTPLTTWSCEPPLSLPIAVTLNLHDMPSPIGRLACSPDGSLFAAAYQADADSESSLYLLSASPLEIHSSLSDLTVSGLKAIALLSQHLIILSEILQVYDIVNSFTQFVHKVTSGANLKQESAMRSTHLAVNPSSETFAVVTPKGTDLESRVVVYNATQPRPLLTTGFRRGTVAILPLSGCEQRGKGGYIILDDAASIRHFQPQAKKLTTANAKIPKSKAKRLVGLGSLFDGQGNRNKALIVAKGASEETSETVLDEMEELDDDETPFVKEHQLKETLDIGSLYNLPRVENLFDMVAGLYISRSTD